MGVASKQSKDYKVGTFIGPSDDHWGRGTAKPHHDTERFSLTNLCWANKDLLTSLALQHFLGILQPSFLGWGIGQHHLLGGSRKPPACATPGVQAGFLWEWRWERVTSHSPEWEAPIDAPTNQINLLQSSKCYFHVSSVRIALSHVKTMVWFSASVSTNFPDRADSPIAASGQLLARSHNKAEEINPQFPR